MRDQEEIVIDDFKGLWDRDDNYPPGYGLTFLNVRFDNKGVFTRESIFTQFDLTPLGLGSDDRVYQFWPYRPSAAPFTQRYIVLVNDHNVMASARFYDTGAATPSTPILSISAAITAASVVQLFDRMYIAPRFGSELVYVYDTTFSPQVARAIAGLAPTSAPAAAVGAAGNCEPGFHLVSVAYETNTGFITKPARTAGVSVATGVTVPSGTPSIISLTAVPLGPAGTVKRHILYTKVIPRYDGNPENYRFFFAGVIADNVTTVFSLSSFDSQLVASSDYLYSIKESITRGMSLSVHEGRLLVNGPAEDGYLVLVSNQSAPETFSAIDGFCIVGKGDGGRVMTAKSFRGNIITFKGRRTYAIQPNDGPPSSWAVITIDVGKGCGPEGVATVVDAPSGTNSEGLFVVSLDGLWFFDGAYAQLPLSWPIEKAWSSKVNRGAGGANGLLNFLCVDPITCRVFIVLNPIYAGSGDAHIMYVCDFSDGLTYDTVKWCNWTNTVGGKPSFMHVEPINVGAGQVETSQLIFSQFSQTVRELKGHLLDRVVGSHDFTDPSNQDIIWGIDLGNFSFPGAEMATFLGFRIRGRGESVVNFAAFGANNLQYSDTNWALPDPFSNYGYTRKLINLVTERIDAIGLINNGSGTSSTMEIKEIVIYGKPTWNRS